MVKEDYADIVAMRLRKQREEMEKLEEDLVRIHDRLVAALKASGRLPWRGSVDCL